MYVIGRLWDHCTGAYRPNTYIGDTMVKIAILLEARRLPERRNSGFLISGEKVCKLVSENDDIC